MAGIGHRGFMGRSASSFCPYLPGLYTESEIDDLVFIDGYIPVYDAAEFDKIRTGSVEVMGGCTKWGGNYTTGVDKKYIQVMDIDCGSSNIMIDGWKGVYDANLFEIINPFSSGAGSSRHIFDCASGEFSEFRNIVINDAFYSGTLNSGSLVSNMYDGIIENCQINGEFQSRGNFGGFCQTITAQTSGVIIRDCKFTGIAHNVSSGGGNTTGVGGIAYIANGVSAPILFENCEIDADIQASNSTSGICPNVRGEVSFINCKISGKIANGAGMFMCNNADEHTIIVNGCSVEGLEITGGSVYGIAFLNSAAAGSTAEFTECVVKDVYVLATNTGSPSLFLRNDSANFTISIDNCLVNNSNIEDPSTLSFNSVVFNLAAGNITINKFKLINCVFESNRTAAGNATAGMLFAQGATINSSDIEIVNCEFNGATNSGAFVARALSGAVVNISNSFSASIINPSTYHGGLTGRNQATITYTDVYWDNTIGPAASGGGTGGSGQSTSQLQTPTSNTGIYANYDPAIWDFGTSSEYPKLINTP